MTTPKYEPDDDPLHDDDLKRLRKTAATRLPRGRLLRRRVLSLALLEQISEHISAGDHAAVSHLLGADLGPRAEDSEPVGIEDLPRFGEDNLLARATRAFGDPARACDWLETPLDRLGGRSPLEVAETVEGARQVAALLAQRIADLLAVPGADEIELDIPRHPERARSADLD